MRVDLFDFDLPEERIALRPAAPRDSARLLAVRPDGEPRLEDRSVRDLPDLLRAGDVLVFNDTKVIPARLHGLRARGEATARVEVLLHKRVGAERWRAFARPAKRLAVGDRIRFGEPAESAACELVRLDAEVEEKGESGEVVLRFSFAGAFLDEAIERFGEMPLPPYIAGRRAPDDARPRRLPDALRPRGGRGRGADRRAAFHRRASAPPRRARHRPRLRHPACRPRHVPAGEGRGHRRAPHARRVRHGVVGGRRGAQRRAGEGRAHRRGRHHRAAAARKRRAPRTARSRRSPARPTSSSRPATASAPSTR